MTNREIVYRAVVREAPCKSDVVVAALDGRLSASQVYSNLSHLTRARALAKTAAGYYEPTDPEAAALLEDDAPEEPEPARGSNGARLLRELSIELDDLSTAPPVEVKIQHLEEKISTLELLERLLTPALAGRVALIREDLQRMAGAL